METGQVRLTLADDRNKNKTENSILILFKRHYTALAIEQKQKQNYYLGECSSANQNTPFIGQGKSF